MLRATTACTFSTSQLPKVVRQWCVLYILTWKCASRHNGVHCFDTFSTSSRQKRLKTLSFFALLTSKCASRHNSVHFFDTFSTSEPPKVVRDRQFLTLLTSKICFAPQRRALFRHLNFQKWSEPLVFLTF